MERRLGGKCPHPFQDIQRGTQFVPNNVAVGVFTTHYPFWSADACALPGFNFLNITSAHSHQTVLLQFINVLSQVICFCPISTHPMAQPYFSGPHSEGRFLVSSLKPTHFQRPPAQLSFPPWSTPDCSHLELTSTLPYPNWMFLITTSLGGFPGSSAAKESACHAGDLSSTPGSGRFPGEGVGYPL